MRIGHPLTDTKQVDPKCVIKRFHMSLLPIQHITDTCINTAWTQKYSSLSMESQILTYNPKASITHPHATYANLCDTGQPNPCKRTAVQALTPITVHSIKLEWEADSEQEADTESVKDMRKEKEIGERAEDEKVGA